MKRLVWLAAAFLVAIPVLAQTEDREFRALYPNHKAVGELQLQETLEYLKLIGDQEAATDVLFLSFGIQHAQTTSGSLPVGGRGRVLKPWEHTEHQLGFLPPGGPYPKLFVPAHRVTPDPSLTKIDISLDKLRVFDYPGSGKHHVLFTFQASNEVRRGSSKTGENAVFNQSYEAQEGQGAGVVGYPIFLGLNVGARGAAFQGATVNVSNDNDEKTLAVLGGGPARMGLELLTTAQPALGFLASLGRGFGEFFLNRHRNRKVSEFFLGLDFIAGASTGARLRAGSYVVVQAADAIFSWSDWHQDADGRIVGRSDNMPIPFNYIILRITRTPTPPSSAPNRPQPPPRSDP